MPIKHAAEKALRKAKKAIVKNRTTENTVQKLVKVGRRAIAAGKWDEAKAIIPKLAKAVDKAASRNIVKRNQANRIKSRFAAALRSAMNKKK